MIEEAKIIELSKRIQGSLPEDNLIKLNYKKFRLTIHGCLNLYLEKTIIN